MNFQRERGSSFHHTMNLGLQLCKLKVSNNYFHLCSTTSLWIIRAARLHMLDAFSTASVSFPSRPTQDPKLKKQQQREAENQAVNHEL